MRERERTVSFPRVSLKVSSAINIKSILRNSVVFQPHNDQLDRGVEISSNSGHGSACE